jgi:hypothetical protein
MGIDGMCQKYNISMSEFCCPVCWELIKALNETNNKVQFVVCAHHSNLYPVCLPPGIPDTVMERMIQCFGKKLYEKFCQLPGTDVLPSPPFVPHHNKNVSLESAEESVSSIGSTNLDTAKVNYQPEHGTLAKPDDDSSDINTTRADR